MEALPPRGIAAQEACTVLRIDEIAGDVLVLELGNPPEFQPGQCVALALAPDDQARYYSVASRPGGTSFCVLFDLVADGYLTPKLAALSVGKTVFRSRAFGSFTEPAGRRSIWWIATGTGVAPFLSMGSEGRTLVCGARGPELLLFRDYFQRALGGNYIQCTTRVQDAATYPGRLTRYLQETDLSGDYYMLCGSADMVVDVREILLRRGVPFSEISSEIYF